MDTAYCDALKVALEFENKGERMYRQAATQAKNDFTRRALEFLADEEIGHVVKIQDFNEAMLAGGQADVDRFCTQELPDRVRAFLDDFTSREATKMAAAEDAHRVYDEAMAMEREGYRMYEEARESSKDEQLRRFFEFMVAEEGIHYRMLEAAKKYLQDPSYYFEDYGGWIFA